MRHLPIAASPVSPGPALANRRHVLAAGAATLVAPLAWSQASVPSKPVTLIVPFTAGGASDVGARMLGTELGKLLGQTVVVENLAGAGGALAVQKLIRAPADGHTLLYGGMSESLLVPLINPSLGYKPEDMLPVALAPERIWIIVAGVGGPQSMVTVPWGYAHAVWRKIPAG